MDSHDKNKSDFNLEGSVEEPAIDYNHWSDLHVGASFNDTATQERNFDFLKKNHDFIDLYTFCYEAEVCQLTDPSKSALSCRRALEYITKAIYLLKGFNIPERASLFELVDAEEFKGFINDDILMKNLHYIRKAGNNAAHLGNVSRKESFFSVLNLHNFVGSVLMMLGVIDTFPRFDRALLTQQKEVYVSPKSDVEPNPVVVKKYEKVAEDAIVLKVAPLPQYFTEAETRELYIDQLLREAGWQVATEKNVFAPNMVGVEISTAGMPNRANVGHIDYVIYG